MPLDRFVLYVVIGAAAVAALVYGALLVFGAVHVGPLMLIALVPVGLVAYIVWRVIADRLASREDDHYDRIED